MAIDPEIQAQLDRLDARIDNLRQLTIAAFAADELRLDESDDRWRRLRERFRDGHLGMEERTTMLDALALNLGMGVEQVRAAFLWVITERAKARASRG